MIKAAVAIGSAAILAGLISALPAPKVEAGTPASEVRVATLDPATQKSTAADPTENRNPGADCSQRAWPYYEQGCLVDFDARWRGEPRKVRLVTTDRIR